MKKSFLIYLVALLIVTGIFGYVVLSQNRTEKTDENTNQIVDTSDWKTYTNEKFGYSVKYPDNWEYSEFLGILSGAKFMPGDEENEAITIKADYYSELNMLSRLTTEEFIKQSGPEGVDYPDYLNSIDKITTQSDIEGYKATWVVDSQENLSSNVSNPETHYYNSKKIKIVGIDELPINDFNSVEIKLINSNYENIYNEMIRTFSVFESEETVTYQWITYENKEKGFKLSLPENYQVIEEKNEIIFDPQLYIYPYPSIEISSGNIDKIADKIINLEDEISYIISDEKITFKNTPAQKIVIMTALGLEVNNIILNKNGIIYHLSFINDNISNKIMESIEFLNN